MKRYFLTFIFSGICSLYACAQIHSNEIQYSKGGIYYDNRRITKPREVGSILLQHKTPDMPQFVRKYKTNNGVAAVFGGLGGGAVGFSLGSAIGGGKVDTALIGAGVGSILIGILFDSVARKNLKLAVNTYNTSYQKPVQNEAIEK